VSDGQGADKQDWRRAVDERLIRRCEQHERDGKQLVFRQRLRTYAATPKVHVEPEAWGAGYLREPRDYDPPIQLIDDLRQRSPQSLLRDLYRPVHEVRWYQFEPIEGTALKPFSGFDEARQKRSVELIAPRVEPIVRTVIAFLFWRIGMMKERWEPFLPDDAPRRSNVIM
jgi:hypothetical protein